MVPIPLKKKATREKILGTFSDRVYEEMNDKFGPYSVSWNGPIYTKGYVKIYQKSITDAICMLAEVLGVEHSCYEHEKNENS